MLFVHNLSKKTSFTLFSRQFVRRREHYCGSRPAAPDCKNLPILTAKHATPGHFSCLFIHSKDSSFVSGKRQWPLVGVTARVFGAAISLYAA